jgi:predicted AAA+ superfamily ATPase
MMNNTFRRSHAECLKLLEERLAEPAPSRIQILTGPRQVGKTTLLLDLAEELGNEAIYLAGDGPEAGLPGSWDRLWARAEETASTRGRAVVLLDEVQHFSDWSARLKGEWDRLRRRRRGVHVVATGSSALRIGAGSKESLAGRFERLALSHWSASDLAKAFALKPEEAARLFVRMGSYPGATPLRRDVTRWSAYIHDAIVEPALGKDILSLAEVRRPAMLRQIFAVCSTSPAQILSLQKMQGQLHEAGALETIASYLSLLEEAYLLAPVEKHAQRVARRRASPPKLITLNNALLSVFDPKGIPDASTDPARFGAWVENACLAHAWNSGQRVTYWREEPFEVDGVLQGSWGHWAVEVKTGPFTAADLRGLFEFTRRHTEYRPLVLCDPASLKTAERLGVQTRAWSEYLLSGPPRDDR